VFGFIAQRLRLPALAGYLLAGIVIGPFTPGFVADQKLAAELAEVGVILLMFGVGLHFSPKDLLSVRAIALPGALGQIVVATILGLGLALTLGWTIGAGIVFGLALSVASTVVLLRALQERGLVETERGRIAVGWLIVEDLVMVATLVLVPPLAQVLGGAPVGIDPNPDVTRQLGVGPVIGALLVTAVKIGVFVLLMLVVGRKIVPWMLHYVAHLGSREMFRLSVLAIALGIAFGSAKLFGVSFALGAFFAGMVLAGSPLSQQAANETLPLRDAFAVLFFVSVGMLFDPAVLIAHPIAVLSTFLTIVVGKSAVAYLIVRSFGHQRTIALAIAASLAQIGEFSFILAVLGVKLMILPDLARDLVVAGALLSILMNPFAFLAADRLSGRDGKTSAAAQAPTPPRDADGDADLAARTDQTGHAILVGYGGVGSHVGAALKASGMPFLVVEDRKELIDDVRGNGIEAIRGQSGDPAVMDRANVAGAQWLIVAIPDVFEAGRLVEAARAANAGIRIVAHARTGEQRRYLKSLGADVVLADDEEIALGIVALIRPQPDRPSLPEGGASGATDPSVRES